MNSRRPAWHTTVAYASFAASGLGCALPGALLPALLVHWHLQDNGAGVLFLVIATGSAIGALSLLRHRAVSLLLACALITLSALTWASGRHLFLLAGFTWGMGLGMLMTAISLGRQQFATKKTMELVRLNLLWAAGACLCPVLLTHSLRANAPRGILIVIAILFATLGIALALTHPSFTHPTAAPARRTKLSLAGIPAALILATVLSTGVEASGGAWLATYAARSQEGLTFIVAAPTCLWAGLLLSRALGSLPWAEFRLRRSFLPLLILVAAASASLLIPTGAVLLLSAFALGFGLGPIYPILLARVLHHRQTGSIFFLCGVGSALMPLLTGFFSTRFHSLRAGLAVLTLGAFTLLLLGISLRVNSSSDLIPKKAG